MSIGRERLRRSVEFAHERRRPMQIAGQSPSSPDRMQVDAPRGIVDFWREDLVVRVGAGTTVAELDRFLAEFDFELGVHGGNWDTRSVGECFARGRAGLGDEDLREAVLSALVIDGRGHPLELGARVVKNVAGYDLLRLHFGAGGAFAAIADLVLRVRARPELRQTRQFHSTASSPTEVLLESRARSADSTTAEVLLGSALLGEFDVDADGSPWLLFSEGRAQEMDDWSRRVGGRQVDLTADRLLSQGDDTRGEQTVVDAYVSSRWVLEHAMAWLDSVTNWWWMDVRRGVLRLCVDGRRWPELHPRLQGTCFVVAGMDIEASASELEFESARERWLRNIKGQWDPAGIFPSLPRPL